MTLTPQPEATATTRPRKWVLPLLVASLSLNLLIAGFLLGGAWLMRHHPPGLPGRMGGMAAGPINRFVDGLPAERRTALADAIGKHRQAVTSSLDTIRQANRDVIASLTVVPFDRAKFETVLRQLAEAQRAARTNSVPSAGAVVEQLTETERQGLSRSMRRANAFSGVGKDPDPPPGADGKVP